jgi:hypothetical protein
MYNVPWQNGRVFQTPVGILAASFVLRPNTMFHPEGEWSVRLVLPHLQAYRLRQLIAPAYDDVVARAKDMYLQLPLEQQARRPFKENAFWQAASTEGGHETENIYFSFRLPTIDRHVAVTAEPPAAASATAGEKTATEKTTAEKTRRKRKAGTGTDTGPDVAAEPVAPKQAKAKCGKGDAIIAGQVAAEGTVAENIDGKDAPVLEVATRVPLLNRHGEAMNGLTLEPDGWSASVHFSIHQYWLRTFGAGVTLRLNAVQLFSQHQRQGELIDEVDLQLPIAL